MSDMSELREWANKKIKLYDKMAVEAPYLYASDVSRSMLHKVVELCDKTTWHYPSRGELPDKDWSKHLLNVSKECFVLTKRGIGTIARWDNDYKTWFENQPHLPVPDVIAWQYFVSPEEEDDE